MSWEATCPAAVTAPPQAAERVPESRKPPVRSEIQLPSPSQSTRHSRPLLQSVASSMQRQGVVSESTRSMAESTTLPISRFTLRCPTASW